MSLRSLGEYLTGIAIGFCLGVVFIGAALLTAIAALLG